MLYIHILMNTTVVVIYSGDTLNSFHFRIRVDLSSHSKLLISHLYPAHIHGLVGLVSCRVADPVLDEEGRSVRRVAAALGKVVAIIPASGTSAVHGAHPQV